MLVLAALAVILAILAFAAIPLLFGLAAGWVTWARDLVPDL